MGSHEVVRKRIVWARYPCQEGRAIFAVKIGNEAFHSSMRLGVLIEEAVMDIARLQSGPIGLTAGNHLWLDFGLLCPYTRSNRAAMVVMEFADCSAREIWKGIGKSFRAAYSVY